MSFKLKDYIFAALLLIVGFILGTALFNIAIILVKILIGFTVIGGIWAIWKLLK